MADLKDRSEEEIEQIRQDFHGVYEDHIDLFVYGTMMSDQHVRLLLNRKVESEPAVLHNYMRVVPPGAFYFVVKQHGATAPGRLLKDLSPEVLERLDAFEDEVLLAVYHVSLAAGVASPEHINQVRATSGEGLDGGIGEGLPAQA